LAQENERPKSFVEKFKKSSYVLAPVIAYSPETSWRFGFGGKYLFRPKSYDSLDTRKSFVAASCYYTLKNQILTKPNFTWFFNHEDFILIGNYSYKKFPQNYYGLGNATLNSNKETISFQEFKVEQILFRKLYHKTFIGLGFKYNNFFDLEFSSDGLLSAQKPFGYNGSKNAGYTLNFRHDTRDNVLNAHEGALIDVSNAFMTNKGSLAPSNNSFRFFQLDCRKFIRPFKHREDVLAGQFFMQSAPSGDVPISELAWVGSDMIMRGYYAKRFIDRNSVSTQVEYRRPLPRNFGVVAFAGLGDVYENLNDLSLMNIKYSVGAGVRYKIIPKEDINIRFDVGFGKNSNSFYVNIAESF